MTGSNFKIATLAMLAIPGMCAQASATPSAADDAAALRMALDDEYRAVATYAAVIEAHGEVLPFIHIIEAERRHVDRAKAEMDRLGISYEAQNPYLGTLAAPETVMAACEQGVTAEIENIALYDRILPTIEDASVHAALTDLQWASRERHLPAFERCVARGGEMGPGHGRGGHTEGRGQGHGRGHGQGHNRTN